MPDKKLFNLHLEFGENSSHEHYVKMIFNDGTEFRNDTSYLTDAISSAVYRLEKNGLLEKILNGSIKSIWPFPGASLGGIPTLPANGQKLRAADLTQVNPPDCHSLCQTYDHFRDKKCKNICASKFNL